ncbi:MAG: acyl-CoA thioesterase [Parvularculaceae bacterium]
MTSPADFAFLHPLRVRWNECDAQGIVFNVNYFLYYDVAVWEWTRALGYASWADAPEFITAHAECDFKGSAFFDDELRIGIRAARIGVKSLDCATAIFRGDEILNAGKLTYVYVQKGTRLTAPLPAGHIDRLMRFERIVPLRK